MMDYIFITTLPDGQLSIMTRESSRLRSQLAITSTAPLGMPLTYHPVESCSFREVRDLYDEAPTDHMVKLSIIKTVEEKLLVKFHRNDRDLSTYNARDLFTYKNRDLLAYNTRDLFTYNNRGLSTYVISNRGQLYGFTAIDPSSSERVTPDNYKAVSQQKLNKAEALLKSRHTSLIGESPHPINEFSLVIPTYTANSLSTGTPKAFIPSLPRADYRYSISKAAYEYRGTTFFHGVRAGVFDLVRYEPMNPLFGPPVIGFSIVDLSTTLPLLVVLDSSGFKYEFKRVSCTG
jgi:hypothetical protein